MDVVVGGGLTSLTSIDKRKLIEIEDQSASVG
jgi:hypothetical protein